MKTVGNALMALSLALALVAASAAYLVDLERHGEQLAERAQAHDPSAPDGPRQPVALAEDVRVPGEGEERPTLARLGETIDAELLERLRAEQVRRVRVRDFAWGRWDQRWLFVLGLAGLAAGALLTRRAAARALVLPAAGAGGGRSPSQELAAIRAIVGELLETWPAGEPPRGHTERVLTRLNAAIEEHGPNLVAQRERIVARLGLGGYAALMDRFAAAERQIHRAWSSAADGVLEETLVCLGRARVILGETAEALGDEAAA